MLLILLDNKVIHSVNLHFLDNIVKLAAVYVALVQHSLPDPLL